MAYYVEKMSVLWVSCDVMCGGKSRCFGCSVTYFVEGKSVFQMSCDVFCEGKLIVFDVV